MDKSNRKTKKYDALKALIVKKLAEKYEVEPAFVRMSINGDRESETAVEIKKEFAKQYQKLNTTLTESI